MYGREIKRFTEAVSIIKSMNIDTLYEEVRIARYILGILGADDRQSLVLFNQSIGESVAGAHSALLRSLHEPKSLNLSVHQLKDIWYRISSQYTTDDNNKTWLDIHNDIVLKCTKKVVSTVDESVRGYNDIFAKHSSACCRLLTRIDAQFPITFDNKERISSFTDYISFIRRLLVQGQEWTTKFYAYKVTYKYDLGICPRYEYKNEIHGGDYVTREFYAVTVNNLFSFKWMFPSDLYVSNVCTSTTDVIDDHQFRAPSGSSSLLDREIFLYSHWEIPIYFLNDFLSELFLAFFGTVYKSELSTIYKFLSCCNENQLE